MPDSWKTKRLVLILYSVVLVAALYVCGFYLVEDVRGSNATATVVEVEPADRYQVRYVTADGIECTVNTRWSRLGQPALEIGDTIVMHHPDNGPCSNVRNAEDYGQPIVTLLGLTTLTAGFGLCVYFFRPFRGEQADAV